MLSLALALLLTQAPPPPQEAPRQGVVVLVSNGKRLTPIESDTLAVRLSQALQESQVKVAASPSEALAQLGKRSPESCGGKSTCLAELGRKLGASAVVAIEASKLFDDLPIRIFLIDTRQGEELLRRSYVVSTERPAELDSTLREAAQELKKAAKDLPGLEAPPPEPPRPPVVVEAPKDPADAPKLPAPVDLTPRPAEPPPAAVAGLGQQQPSPVPRYVLQGAAGAAALAAGTFAVLGLLQRGEFEQTLSGNTSTLTWQQAQPRLDSINGRFTLAGALGVAASALLVTSFALPGPPPPAQPAPVQP